MKFSKRSRYGLRAMAQLTKHWKEKVISLTEISRQENISKKYLEHIFADLKKAKLVESGRGHYGGYKLAQDPQKISVLEIVEAIEGKISPSNCLEGDGNVLCGSSSNCGVVPLLVKIQNEVKKILKETSLSDIEKNHNNE